MGFAALNPRQFIDFSYGKFGGLEAVALPGDPTATRSEPSDLSLIKEPGAEAACALNRLLMAPFIDARLMTR